MPDARIKESDLLVMELKKLAGDTTHNRKFAWLYHPDHIRRDPTVHGDILLGPTLKIHIPPGDREIELGGDPSNPFVRPNVNIVPGPAVDILHDLNNPFPLESNTYDFVCSTFVYEHIKNSRIRQFISECCRITKPGGWNLHIGPNLKAQCAAISRLENWTHHDINMIFAGEERADREDPWEGYHHTGMSPDLAVKLFKESGFSEVVVWEYPKYPLEMMIESWK